ncbi:MAG: TIGR03013 family PEP-CTERM/XrtA system glycosyltransferase [Candidatus Omnitrophica bacterium]|nr:TIGR03013 family PEP-CTERM/XrtA system glycosyltransferase [Candidatus Omnitrophota bacterium]
MVRKYGRYRKLLLLLGDIFFIILSVYLAVAIRLGPDNVLVSFTGATTFVVVVYTLCFYVFDLYGLKYKVTNTIFLAQYVLAVCVGALMVTVVFYAVPNWKFGRGIVLLNTFFIASLVYLWRVLLQNCFSFIQKNRVLIAGAGVSGRAIYGILKERDEYEIEGFVDDDQTLFGERIGDHAVLGDSGKVPEIIQQGKVDAIIVAITHEKRGELLSVLLEAKMSGITVVDVQKVYEDITGKLAVNHLREGWLVYSELKGLEGGIYAKKAKPIISYILASLMAIALLPVCFLAAALIFIESGRPVFFTQKRVGLNGKLFEIVKFRSMIVGAEEKGAVWTVKNDSRITSIGRIIRRLRVDEIPQLINVIKGEMSLIGPRPERPEFIEELTGAVPFYSFRHVVKPGITGWAQVNYRYGASVEDALEKMQYDLFYVKNLSVVLDLRIILKTVRVVLLGAGAR